MLISHSIWQPLSKGVVAAPFVQQCPSFDTRPKCHKHHWLVVTLLDCLREAPLVYLRKLASSGKSAHERISKMLRAALDVRCQVGSPTKEFPLPDRLLHQVNKQQEATAALASGLRGPADAKSGTCHQEKAQFGVRWKWKGGFRKKNRNNFTRPCQIP